MLVTHLNPSFVCSIRPGSVYMAVTANNRFTPGRGSAAVPAESTAPVIQASNGPAACVFEYSAWAQMSTGRVWQCQVLPEPLSLRPEGSQRPAFALNLTPAQRAPLFVSCWLHAAEQCYSQLDKEGLGLMFRVECVHQYLWGWKFEVVTDYKLLLGHL